MNESGCPACSNVEFKLDLIQTGDKGMNLYMVRCRSCGKVVYVYDANIYDLLSDIKKILTERD
jgi:uncharacterized Zn finger protein